MNVSHSQRETMTALAINKSLLKEFVSSKSPRTVFMDGGQEFQIQLFNPYHYRIGAKISINGEELSDTLVIRPGERIWLDRYLSTPRKFKFDTYEVDGGSAEVRDAIRKNGNIMVRFYKEKQESSPVTISSICTSEPYWYPRIRYSAATPSSVCGVEGARGPAGREGKISTEVSCYNVSSGDLGIQSFGEVSVSCANAAVNAVNYSAPIETGRVEKGGHSDQVLGYVDADFEYCSFRTDEICIMPISAKPVSSSDLNKKYCTQCGKKLSPKFKFCPACGAKV